MQGSFLWRLASHFLYHFVFEGVCVCKIPSSWPRSARKGGPKRPTARPRHTELGALKRYAGRHFMRAPVCRSSLARFFAKQALSLQSCAFWRTQPASFPPWSVNFYDFFGFCPWRLQPGCSWARFSWFWLDFGLSSAQFNPIEYSSVQSSSVQFSSVKFSSVQSSQSSAVQFSPVWSSPVWSSPAQFSPVQFSSVQSSSVRPVQSGPVWSGPVRFSPVQSSPAWSSPVRSSPVQSSPARPSSI